MRALILAAGFGSRLMPLTKDKPKCMVEYQGKKIIDYELEALNGAGISKIAVVGGYLENILKEYLKEKYHLSDFYTNSKYDTTNMVQTLFCARKWLESCIENKEDLIISYADIVYFKDIIAKLKGAKYPLSIVVDKEWRSLWEKRFSEPLSDAETLKIENGKIIELGRKPKGYDEIMGQYIGLFKISYEFLPQVLMTYDELDRSGIYDGKDFLNMYMTSFLQVLIEKYKNAYAVEIFGNWCEIDFKGDLDVVL